jgi:acetyl esterase
MIAPVDPEMAAILEELQRQRRTEPDPERMAEARAEFEEAAKAWNRPRPGIGPVEDVTMMGSPTGPLHARLYLPAGRGPFAVTVFAHGGGWAFGSLESHDRICRQIAKRSACAVLAVDYRLTPEHPYPAALDDVLSAIRFAAAGELGPAIDARRIAVAGDSAGANLALGAMVVLRETDPEAISAGALIYGCYAPDFETESHRRLGDGSYVLTTEGMRRYWGWYLGGTGEPDALAAPLKADLSGLPPLYLSAAGLDPLLDDTLVLSRHLAAAQVSHRLDVFPGVVHGFLRMTRGLGVARTAMDRLGDALKEALGG